MIKRGLIVALLIAGAVQAAPAAGRWEGTLNLSGRNLRLIFELKGLGPGLSGKLESPDLKAAGMPVTGRLSKGTQVDLGVPSMSGTFSGKLSDDGKTMAGTWVQGGWKPLVFTRVKGSGEGLLGDWKGALPNGNRQDRMVFHFVKEKGQLVARLENLDQGARRVRMNVVKLVGKKLFIRSKNLGAKYNATLGKDGNTLDGHWWQGIELPLTLQRRG